jgi:hypothetical protein
MESKISKFEITLSRYWILGFQIDNAPGVISFHNSLKLQNKK